MRLPRIALTVGEPAGIGPDLVIQVARENFNAEIIALADPNVLKERAAVLNLGIELRTFKSASLARKHVPGSLTIQPIQVSSPVSCGQLNIDHVNYVLESISTATQGCLSGQFHAMVTGPVNKAIILQAGFNFSGHTEFIADLCDKAFPVMLLANEKMRIALVTTHLPLARVSEQITAARLEKVISIAAIEMVQRFGLADPRLLVCGLNPHAGEQGYLGNEEIAIIIPVLNKLRESGLRITGPVPADTAFTPASLNDIDLVISMYHDQGLPVLKSQGFGNIVNITLGLPIIRTSVDHGTALDLAGTGRASSSSLSSAIQLAIKLAKKQMTKAGSPTVEAVTN